MVLSACQKNNNNILAFQQDEVSFSFDLLPEINQGLQQAARNISDREQSLSILLELNEKFPQQPEILIALFKSYFYLGDLDRAEEFIFQCLVQCSILGEFPLDWKSLSNLSYDWSLERGVGRYYLYSLKALAFVRLKQNDLKDSSSILKVLKQLDPEDKVGASVICSLLTAIMEEMDGS